MARRMEENVLPRLWILQDTAFSKIKLESNGDEEFIIPGKAGWFGKIDEETPD